MIPSYSHSEIARLRRTNCRRQINGGSLLKVPVPRFLPSFSGRRPHFQSPLLLRGARKEVEVICAEIRLFHVPFPCSFHSFRLIAASSLFVQFVASKSGLASHGRTSRSWMMIFGDQRVLRCLCHDAKWHLPRSHTFGAT